jgi:hypothetical protein
MGNVMVVVVVGKIRDQPIQQQQQQQKETGNNGGIFIYNKKKLIEIYQSNSVTLEKSKKKKLNQFL